MKTYHRQAFLVFLFLAAYGPVSAETASRNVQIEVTFKSAATIQQSSYFQSTQQSSETQILVISDGHEGRLFIGKQTPRIEWYRTYLANEGYLTGNVVFRDIGTNLIVKPRIVGDQIEITLTPEVSYETQDGTGSIAVTRLSTTVVVADGQSLEIGGSTARSPFENNFYTRESGSTVQIVLTPRIL